TGERICKGEERTLDAATGDDFVQLYYRWSTDPNDTFRFLTVADSGQYTVQIADAYGCKNYDTFNLYVNEVPLDAGLDSAICELSYLNRTATGADSFTWFAIPDMVNPISTSASVTHQITANTVYIVN